MEEVRLQQIKDLELDQAGCPKLLPSENRTAQGVCVCVCVRQYDIFNPFGNLWRVTAAGVFHQHYCRVSIERQLCASLCVSVRVYVTDSVPECVCLRE